MPMPCWLKPLKGRRSFGTAGLDSRSPLVSWRAKPLDQPLAESPLVASLFKVRPLGARPFRLPACAETVLHSNRPQQAITICAVAVALGNLIDRRMVCLVLVRIISSGVSVYVAVCEITEREIVCTEGLWD